MPSHFQATEYVGSKSSAARRCGKAASNCSCSA
ncbi:Uncharacterised protein [Bordetella pertussis]|nr:Uncharacterised protein [Bordetella pertussis]